MDNIKIFILFWWAIGLMVAVVFTKLGYPWISVLVIVATSLIPRGEE